MKTLTRTLAVIASSFAVIVSQATLTASAGTYDNAKFRVVQLNMYGFHEPASGNFGYNIHTPDLVLGYAAYSPDATRPVAFTLQEVYIGGFYHAATQMAQWGHNGTFSPTMSRQWNGTIHPHGPNGYALEKWGLAQIDDQNCPMFGNALFWRGSAASMGGLHYSWQKLTSSHEYRNWLCAEPYFLGAKYRVCTTHFQLDGAHGGLDFKYWQSSEFEPWVQGFIGLGRTVLVGMDANTGAADMRPFWFNNMKDADLGCTSTSGPDCESMLYNSPKKFDYLMRANPKAWSADAYTTFNGSGWIARISDHKLLQGYL